MAGTLPSNAGGAGSTPGLEAKIPHACDQSQKIKHRQYCNKFNKDFFFKKRGLSLKKKDTVSIFNISSTYFISSSFTYFKIQFGFKEPYLLSYKTNREKES